MAYLNGVVEGCLLKVLLAGVGRYNKVVPKKVGTTKDGTRS